MVLKTINHMLNIMTGNDLAAFAVPEESVLKPGVDLRTAKITPVEDMMILKMVPLALSLKPNPLV